MVTGNDDSDINLSPVFSPDNTDYSASLSRHVNELTLTFPHHKGSITVNTVPVPPGGALTLPAGTPAITIDSTAEDGVSTRRYTIALQRTGCRRTSAEATWPRWPCPWPMPRPAASPGAWTTARPPATAPA